MSILYAYLPNYRSIGYQGETCVAIIHVRSTPYHTAIYRGIRNSCLARQVVPGPLIKSAVYHHIGLY